MKELEEQQQEIIKTLNQLNAAVHSIDLAAATAIYSLKKAKLLETPDWKDKEEMRKDLMILAEVDKLLMKLNDEESKSKDS